MSKKSNSPFSPWSSPDPSTPGTDASSDSDGSALDTAAADLSAAAAELQSFAQQLTASPTVAQSQPIQVNVTVTDFQGEALSSSTETDGPDLSLLT